MVNTVNGHIDARDTSSHSAADAYAVAARVCDPELPFLTVADLGILRDVTFEKNVVVAKVSPTYSGCPAVSVIEQAVQHALEAAGFNARIERVMTPAWTTAWITPAGRAKLRAHGITPPVEDHAMKTTLFAKPDVSCPACGTLDTRKLSEFGSTPCKAQYQCNACAEPFDYFKCL